MSSENLEASHGRENKDERKKCCHMGLHSTKNGICVQTMRPFRMSENTGKSAPIESEFVRRILDNKIDGEGPEIEDSSDQLGIETIIRQFESCFDIGD